MKISICVLQQHFHHSVDNENEFFAHLITLENKGALLVDLFLHEELDVVEELFVYLILFFFVIRVFIRHFVSFE